MSEKINYRRESNKKTFAPKGDFHKKSYEKKAPKPKKIITVDILPTCIDDEKLGMLTDIIAEIPFKKLPIIPVTLAKSVLFGDNTQKGFAVAGFIKEFDISTRAFKIETFEDNVEKLEGYQVSVRFNTDNDGDPSQITGFYFVKPRED